MAKHYWQNGGHWETPQIQTPPSQIKDQAAHFPGGFAFFGAKS